MAQFIECEVKGLDKLVENLLKEGKEGRLAVKKALDAGGGVVKKAMHDEAPVEEGGRKADHLQNNIIVRSKIKGGDEVAARVQIGPSAKPYPDSGTGKEGTVSFTTRSGKKVSFDSKNKGQVSFYDVGRFLEFGTRRGISPDPWMTRAWESCKQVAQDRIISKLKEALGLS
jgi:HK97 gp10 family phage protein